MLKINILLSLNYTEDSESFFLNVEVCCFTIGEEQKQHIPFGSG